MADLYVVFDGEECIGLAATLDDAKLVAEARTGESLGVEWAPTTPHGWLLPGTPYRTLLKPVTNRGRIPLTPTRAPVAGRAGPRQAGRMITVGAPLRHCRTSGVRDRVGAIVRRAGRRLAGLRRRRASVERAR
jgi:hypothetical protein